MKARHPTRRSTDRPTAGIRARVWAFERAADHGRRRTDSDALRAEPRAGAVVREMRAERISVACRARRPRGGPCAPRAAQRVTPRPAIRRPRSGRPTSDGARRKVRYVRREAGQSTRLIAHGQWVRGRIDRAREAKFTAVRSVPTDLAPAGDPALDEPGVIEGNVITARFPPTFRPGFRQWGRSGWAGPGAAREQARGGGTGAARAFGRYGVRSTARMGEPSAPASLSGRQMSS